MGRMIIILKVILLSLPNKPALELKRTRLQEKSETNYNNYFFLC